MLDLALSIESMACCGRPAFNPLSISPKLWLDPSDKSTMFQSGTRASPGAAVVNDGDPVGLILDKSGNNNDFVQATTTKRPLFKTSGGLSWLQFDGVDDFLVSAATINLTAFSQLGTAIGFTPLSTAVQMVAEHGPATASTAGGFYLAAPNDPGAGQFSAAVNGNGSADGVNTTATTYGSGITSLATFQSLDVTGTVAAARLPLRVNGAAIAISTESEGGGAGTTFSTQTMYLGARGGTSLPFNGKIFGLLIKGGGFTAQQLAQVETYEGAKCGLTL